MKVLIVDDNSTNLDDFQVTIDSMPGSHLVACYTDAHKALAHCQQEAPDLLLVDYLMPQLNGIEFIHAFRTLPNSAGVPVVMLTAGNSSEIRDKALDSGASDFLQKPVARSEFIARVGNLLSLRASQTELEGKAEWLETEVSKATSALRQQDREAMIVLSKAAEYRDPETGAHISRMSHYSKLIARQLDLDEAEQELILTASPMHDVGKVGTPDDILLKAGKLDPAERDIIELHASHGHEILKQGSSPLMQAAAEIALTHHEKYNGEGYPNGLCGEDIPLRGRIVSVADVFDALTSERPYKEAWPIEKATDLLKKESGSHFDPQCVEAFLAVLDEVLEIKESFKE